MSKSKIVEPLVLGILAMLIGIVFIFYSTNLGTHMAESWLESQGGAASTGYYQIIVSKSINSFLVTGSILFAVGLIVTTGVYLISILKNQNEQSKSEAE